MAFKVIINPKEPGIFMVTVVGSLDSNTHAIFEKEIKYILVPTTQAVIIDMQGVDYISSLGIGVIFKITKLLNDQKATLLLTNLQPQIKKVMETVRALPESIFTSLEEADEYLRTIQKKTLEDQ